MKKPMLLVLSLTIATLIVSCAPPLSTTADGTEKSITGSILPFPVQVTVKTDKPVYYPGEKVLMSLTAVNMGSKPVTLRFPTSQRYDFIVSYAGRKFWQWSDGKIFLPVVGEIILKPRQSVSFRTMEFTAKVPPVAGIIEKEYTFDLTGLLTATPSLSGQTRFRVSRYIPL